MHFNIPTSTFISYNPLFYSLRRCRSTPIFRVTSHSMAILRVCMGNWTLLIASGSYGIEWRLIIIKTWNKKTWRLVNRLGGNHKIWGFNMTNFSLDNRRCFDLSSRVTHTRRKKLLQITGITHDNTPGSSMRCEPNFNIQFFRSPY